MTTIAEQLHERFAGELVTPGDSSYNERRSVWNATVDRRPAVIARCTSTSDVVAAVRAAVEEGLEITVRCGGHSVAGHAVVDDGLMVDLSPMRRADVDVEARRASVQGGALLGDLDRAAQRVGHVTPAGVVSHTGVGGLTLGGGFGWLSRMHGLSCDNLLEAEVVTATGDIVVASEDDDAELLWALRGGGGNFGVVTRFDLRVHPFDGQIWTATLTYSGDDGPAAMAALSEVAAEAPRGLTFYAQIGAGRGALVPEEWTGRPMIMVSAVYVGDRNSGEALVAPLRAARPIGEFDEETTYLALQSRADADAAPGMRRYWKAHFLPALDETSLTTFLEQGLRAVEESEHVGCELFALGGAARDVGPGETAFANREAEWDFIATGTWTDPADDEHVLAVSRRAAEAMAPFAEGVYTNDLGDEGTDRIRAAYGETTYERLVRVKDRLDPANVFRHNQNVRPSRF